MNMFLGLPAWLWVLLALGAVGVIVYFARELIQQRRARRAIDNVISRFVDIWISFPPILLSIVLMAVFPISKLLHAPGLFFSPSRNQVDNPRERRHLAPWAAALERDAPTAAGQ